MSTVPKTQEKNNSLLWFLYVRNYTLDGVEWDYDRKKYVMFQPCPCRESRYIALDHPPTIISPAPGRDGPAPWLALACELTRSTLSPGVSSLLLPVRHLSGRINMPIVEAETPGTPQNVDSTVWRDAAAAPAPAPTAPTAGCAGEQGR
ncbi:unnamed protein product [Pleuronectes platessa]|uniref:Uncharacterized protein n=1 Tax=Pleuronectes platessa TaxID=8262 RepID=A0A9N7U0P7_PLEPL|nr:unnamed protein product [Pleuronectes platessa]